MVSVAKRAFWQINISASGQFLLQCGSYFLLPGSPTLSEKVLQVFFLKVMHFSKFHTLEVFPIRIIPGHR